MDQATQPSNTDLAVARIITIYTCIYVDLTGSVDDVLGETTSAAGHVCSALSSKSIGLKIDQVQLFGNPEKKQHVSDTAGNVSKHKGDAVLQPRLYPKPDGQFQHSALHAALV